MRRLIFSDVFPSQPLVFIVAGPERSIALPQAGDLVVVLPIFQRGIDSLFDGGGEVAILALNFWLGLGRLRFLELDRRKQLGKRIIKKLYAVFQKFFRDLKHGNAGSCEIRHDLVRRSQVLIDGAFDPAVVAESVYCCRRHGVHRVRADEFVHIKHIGIARVLGAGAGPQQALRLSAAASEIFPTGAREQLFVFLISLFGIGDGYLSQQSLQKLGLLLAAGVLEPRGNDGIDQRIDAADKEAGHAGDPAEVVSRRLCCFQSFNEGLSNPHVRFLREEKSHVDVDALAGQLADRRNTLRSSRNFDQDILAGYRPPQPASFGDGSLGVPRKFRRNLQAYVAVTAPRGLIDGKQEIGSVLNIADGNALVDLAGAETLRLELLKKIGVIGAAGDGFFKDRGIRGDAAQAILIDQPLQLSAGDQVATDEVQPDGLSLLLQQQKRILFHRLAQGWVLGRGNGGHGSCSLATASVAYRCSMLRVLASRRRCRSSAVKRAFKKVVHRFLASSMPTTRAPRTSTLTSSCSTH